MRLIKVETTDPAEKRLRQMAQCIGGLRIRKEGSVFYVCSVYYDAVLKGPMTVQDAFRYLTGLAWSGAAE